MLFFVLTIVLFIFRSWFAASSLSAGDWPYLFFENIREFSWSPQIRFLWLAPYYQILTKFAVQYLGIPWAATEKIFWFLPFILLSLFGSYRLSRSPLGALIYTTNTYALMIVGGGQMGIAMAYAIAPLVLSRFIKGKGVVLNGLLLSAQVMFDPRIAFLTLIASIIFRPSLRAVGTSIGIAAIFNLYWIIPLLRSHASIAQQLGEATIASAKFLSFATFEQTISLLHPNWPENIFGKVYFMRPEFLFIAIIAFSSLLVKPQSRKMLYFALLALVGAFLAKGTNPPFGEVYAWIFTRVPGFSLFRDPTKFYLFVALAFSVLIPSAVETVKKGKMASFLFIIFWVFTIRQAVFGQLTGTFRPMPIPQEYIQLKDFLYTQPQAFQTLWIPQRQRFGFSSSLHPGLDATELSKESSISGILLWLNKSDAQNEFIQMHVKYIIVPYDSRGELFLTDRTYDERLYLETYNQIKLIPWLHQNGSFANIGVFEVSL